MEKLYRALLCCWIGVFVGYIIFHNVWPTCLALDRSIHTGAFECKPFTIGIKHECVFDSDKEITWC